MGGSSNHDGQKRQDLDKQRQWQWASNAMGGGTAKQSQWAMGWRRRNEWHNGQQRIAANVEAAQ
jgi:hypothetical protein